MTGYISLLRLQLISRFADLKPKNIRAAVKDKKGKAAARALGILVLIAYLGVMLVTVEKTLMDVLIRIGAPDMMLSMIVTATMLSTLIMSFFYIMSSLFLNRDAPFLASLPLKARTVLCAKLTEVWIGETLVSGVLLLPACIQYGIRTGAGAGFYLRLLPVWLTVDILPIAIVSLVSMLLIRLTALWRHREMLTTVFGIAFLALYMLLAANMGGMTGDSASGGEMLQRFILNYSARIDAITSAFPPARWAVRGLMGESGMLALYLAVCAGAAVLTIWLVGLGYRRLSLLQTETPAAGERKISEQQRKQAYRSSGAFAASARREIRSILRTPSYATNILPVSFMPLFMVLVMYFIMSGNLKEEGESVQTLFRQMNGALVTAILTAVMAYISGLNPALSTAVTREGKGHDLMRSLPVSGWTIIRSKFAVGFCLAAAGVLSAGIAMAVLFPGLGLPVTLACVLCLLYTYITSCFALIRDIKKPKLDWMTEQQAVKQNYGVLISMLVSLALLATLGVASYFLISAGLNELAYAGIMAAALVLGCLGMRAWMKKTAERYYARETGT